MDKCFKLESQEVYISSFSLGFTRSNFNYWRIKIEKVKSLSSIRVCSFGIAPGLIQEITVLVQNERTL